MGWAFAIEGEAFQSGPSALGEFAHSLEELARRVTFPVSIILGKYHADRDAGLTKCFKSFYRSR
ncbi:hypothetical protein C8J43_11026 [Sphingomonas sp. PP-CE-1G-424]|nr:hypothetical protein C8J43_11026 [Sphingomonas sp. PP-CE-1G-424]